MSKFNTTLRRGVVAIAVSAALGFAATAYAAEASGIIGNVGGAGYSITIKNTATGSTRDYTTDDSGSFRFTQLPTGEYEVSVMKDGKVVGTDKVRVSIGGNAVANFDLPTSGAETIEVVGARPSVIDVTATDSGLILGETEIDSLPVARSLTSVALLAPGTVQGESRFGDVPSFGGASVSENSCYINGLEVTDTRQGLGCGSVPFEFYKEFQVKTGGYSAQFGRTTGGLINAITKSGTNEWDFAATALWRPKGLMKSGPTSRATSGTGVGNSVAATSNAGLNGVFRDFSDDYVDQKEFTISAGGPLIQDKLFVYALYNPRDVEVVQHGVSGNASRTSDNRYITDTNDDAFWGAKIDWDISEDHRLSAFAYSNRRDVDRVLESLNNYTGARAHIGDQVLERGGEAQSVSYVGHITDDITISALVGEIETQFFTAPSNTTCPNITDSRGVSPTVPSCFVANDGTNFDNNKQQRLDVEWLINDNNILHVGFDYQDRDSENTTVPSGGAAYTYTREAPNANIQIVGHPFTNTTGADLDVVAVRVFTGGGAFTSDMKAFYIEDEMTFGDFTFKAGLRRDELTNYGTTGIAFADFSETAPRLAASWDVNGDGSSKVYATWGRYFLPIANNTNFRMASGVSDATTYYRFAGATATFDPVTGAPTNITPVNGNVADSTNTNSLPVFPDMTTTQSEEATPFYKDELIVGYEREMGEGYTVGLRAMARDVASGLDDYCGDLAPACVLLNPGEGGTWGSDNDGDGTADDGTVVYHSAAEIGLPKAKNEYRSLELKVDHNSADTRWTFLYVWSRSYGNFEGAVKSDIAQADAGITQDFDFPALTDGADGYQPNDRRHVFKFFGSHKLTEQFTVGWNSVLSSGRPLSSFGRGYGTDDPHIYGSYGDTFYLYTGQCPETNGTAGCQPDEKIYEFTPRGSAGRTPWTFNLNLSLDYSFNVSGIEMKASLDVFNVLNSQEVVASNEHYEASEGVRNQYYGAAYSYQTPQYVQLGFEARF